MTEVTSASTANQLDERRVRRFGPLSRKYFGAFLIAILAPLSISGGIEAWFGYEEQRRYLQQMLQSEARGAASKVEGFIANIREHGGWFVQLPWTDDRDERRRIDALRMLRQVPAVISITLIDQHGRERLHVSRLGLNRIESRRDLRQEAAYLKSKAERVWYSPVTYKRGSEPHMLIGIGAVRASAGVAILEVNLKHVWDTISSVKLGRSGKAYIADSRNRLVAHPDISLVLRGEDPHSTQTLTKARQALEHGTTWVSFGNIEVIGSGVVIGGLDWTVYLEKSATEAFEPVVASLRRTGWVLVAGSIFAALLAFLFSRRMVSPILLLRHAARQIGRGKLDHRVSLGTRDEVEELGHAFNEMAAELSSAQDRRERIERLKRFLDPHVAELIDSSHHSDLLSSKRADVVVIFCDLRGFTHFSVDATPEEVMDLLSGYHQAIGRAVNKHRATLLSFLGDGVMILINAPLPADNPPLVAANMALELQGDFESVCASWTERGRNVGFGIGIAMGAATVGRIGFESRMDYAAIGSVTNLAARLCSIAAHGEILVDDIVASSLKSYLDVSFYESKPIKGFPKPINIFRIEGQRSCNVDPIASSLVGDDYQQPSEPTGLVKCLPRAYDSTGNKLGSC